MFQNHKIWHTYRTRSQITENLEAGILDAFLLIYCSDGGTVELAARRALLCGCFFGSNARPRFFAAATGFAAAFSPPEVCWAYSRLKLLPEI